jgi:S1-C subfamily serine protease
MKITPTMIVQGAIAFILGMFLANVAFGAELTPVEQAAATLQKSVVAIRMPGSTVNNCSAAKIGEGKYLTALHCVEEGETIQLPSGRILHVKSTLIGGQKKAGGTGTDHDRFEDWAVLNTVETDDGLTALTLGCQLQPTLGQEVAYAGYPYPTQFSFGTGRVTSTKPTLDERSNVDFALDVHAAPGASGSAVIDLTTGEVVGVLTEGVLSRFGAFMIGIEAITNTDMCEGQPVTAAKKETPAAVAPSEDALTK